MGYQVSALVYGKASMALVVGCILTTYLLYLIERTGDPFLPTISNTWVQAPGNYISRFCVSNGCFMLSIVQIFLYLGDLEISNTNKKMAYILMWMGLVGSFFLSWVGAICDDSTEPSCDGNNTIHTTCAVLFFILYDIKMILTATVLDKSNNDIVLAIIAIFSLLARTKVYEYVLHVPLVTSDWALACFEWTNVTIIVLWTLRQLQAKCAGLCWYFGKFDEAVTTSIIWEKDTATATKITVIFYLATLIFTALLGLLFGYLPVTPHTLWYISDMWAYVPGNWISRWAVVLGAHFGLLAVAGVMADTQNSFRKKLLGLAAFGLFGLMIVGVCNENENITIHTTGAMIFFLSFDIYIIGTLLSLRNHHTEKQNQQEYQKLFILLFPGIIALLSHTLRILAVFPSLDPLLEWSDALAIIYFLTLDVQTYPNTCSDSGLALTRLSSSTKSPNSLKEHLLLV